MNLTQLDVSFLSFHFISFENFKVNAVEIGKGCRTDVKGQSSAMEEDGKALQKASPKGSPIVRFF